ncbi:hypothetical protein LDENG_00005130 [Lucifuga dentata]|nr:hypothetical protein LDENG_00005130 [Lucifuga dentata]
MSRRRSVNSMLTISFLGFVISPGSIKMDPAKIKAVVDWPAPASRKELQRFLGFANFYRCFIWNYSSLAAPLHTLTSHSTPFECFTSAPILTQPDPTRQFIVEVDALDVGVGAVLSQHSPVDHEVHPCAYFSHKLLPAEKNYDIGNWELLAVKLALEEWRHWLEGAVQPFLIWTDHKNLEYIRTAKRLNSRQARWSLFFSRFHFTLSYWPGSHNTKPDTLSHLFCRESSSAEPVKILPEGCVISAITWEIKEEVRVSHHPTPPPSACPENRLFVPENLRSRVLHWIHTSRFSCYPGVR